MNAAGWWKCGGMSAVEIQEGVDRDFLSGKVFEVHDPEDDTFALVSEYDLDDFFPDRGEPHEDETDCDYIEFHLDIGEVYTVGGGASPAFHFYRIR